MIQISINGGSVDHEFHGYERNGHILVYGMELDAGHSDYVEISVSCRVCGKQHAFTKTVESEFRASVMHMYLVSQFEEPCQMEKQELRDMVEDILVSYTGQTATTGVLNEVKSRLEARLPTDEPEIQFV